MAQRGRRSSAHLSLISPGATNTRPPITALKPLTPQEQKIFSMVAAENPHLRQTDAVLLMAFAKAAVGSSNADSAQDFERLSRTLMSLATKLRISPQSRVDPKTLARRINDAGMHQELYQRRPWDRNDPGDEDGDAVTHDVDA